MAIPTPEQAEEILDQVFQPLEGSEPDGSSAFSPGRWRKMEVYEKDDDGCGRAKEIEVWSREIPKLLESLLNASISERMETIIPVSVYNLQLVASAVNRVDRIEIASNIIKNTSPLALPESEPEGGASRRNVKDQECE